jgi:hypothetical protein
LAARIGQQRRAHPQRVRRTQHHQPADQLGVEGGRRPADHPAGTGAHDHRGALTQRADQAGHVRGHRVAVVAARWLVAGTVAPKVDRDGPEARVGHLGQDLVPGPPELREAVQEQH